MHCINLRREFRMLPNAINNWFLAKSIVFQHCQSRERCYISIIYWGFVWSINCIESTSLRQWSKASATQSTQAYEFSHPAASTQFSHHEKQKSDRLWISAKAWILTWSVHKYTPGQVDVWQAAHAKRGLGKNVEAWWCLERIERQLHQQGYSSTFIEQRLPPSPPPSLPFLASRSPPLHDRMTTAFRSLSALSTPKSCKEMIKHKPQLRFSQAVDFL